MNWEQSARWEQNLEIYETLGRIEALLQKLVESNKTPYERISEFKAKRIEVETQQGPVKVLINGIPVEEGDEIV